MELSYNLINQDVFEGLKALESDSFDLCIVDPPYGASSKTIGIMERKEKFQDLVVNGIWKMKYGIYYLRMIHF